MRERKIAIYEAAIAQCPRFERKGKANPYTAANGHMFSQINKDDQLGIRFSKEQQQAYFEELDTGPFLSYGSVMRGYVLMPDWILDDPAKLAALLNEGYDYVNTLEPK
ncbi:MAG: hypothetical protein AAF242_10685 [Bacteroidota bacterium]